MKQNERRVLIIVENLPVPFDRRVWQEATTLSQAGYLVSIICPTGKNHEKRFESIDGINIHRYRNPVEADRPLAYLFEYGFALFWQFTLAVRVALGRGFDVLQACNPPDNIFLIGAFFRIFGKRFIFDHHDVCPELFVAKFGKRGRLYRLACFLEAMSFKLADVSIATNESYRRIAIERGGMDPENVFVVRSGPKLERLKIQPPVPALKNGRTFLVGYVGVMGKQEGIDYLLRAVKHLVEELGRRDIQFGLVGSGTELQALIDYADELGIAEFVTFTGRVDDKQLLDMLNTADICVNPDVANEMNDLSTMNKVMEYMALGKAQVQFDLREGRVSAGEASLYAAKNDEIDLAKKILVLLDDEQLRNRMGQIGKERIEQKLQWQHQVAPLLAAYDKAFARVS